MEHEKKLKENKKKGKHEALLASLEEAWGGINCKLWEAVFEGEVGKGSARSDS